MTEKVTKIPKLLENEELPQLNLENNKFVYFPVAIFQYGLGAYDLYIQTNEVKYIRKFKQYVDWTIKHQDREGKWNNYFYIYPKTPYGAMAQGEAVSLLIRAYSQYGDEFYLESRIDFTRFHAKTYRKGGVILREYTNQQTVLNGWIFAWRGLYDYVFIAKDSGIYQDIMSRSLESIIKYLPKFKFGYWSMYSLDGKVASPFYHNLHIAQMQAMYQLIGREVFNDYARRW